MILFVRYVYSKLFVLSFLLSFAVNSGANADKVASNTDRPEAEKASRNNVNESSPVMKVQYFLCIAEKSVCYLLLSCIIINTNPSVFSQPKPAAAKEAVMDLLSMDDDNSTSSSPPGSAGGNRHRTASGSSGSAAGLSGDVLAEVKSLFIWCVLCPLSVCLLFEPLLRLTRLPELI